MYALFMLSTCAVVALLVHQQMGWRRVRGPAVGRGLVLVLAAVRALFVASKVMGVILSVAPLAGGRTQLEALGVTSVGVFVVRAVHAGIVEEAAGALLVRGLAGRGVPVWGIYLVGAGLRCVYHLYLGWGALSVAIMTAGMIFLYRRYGRVVPLMVAHAGFDLGQVLFPGVVVMAFLAGSVAVVMLWMHEQVLCKR
ncbi:CPBP family glutamic-type intramembrane protease [Sphaerisporangium album]|uniref:CPBP family glutamic-type intramembrane protease n=1 Tax=Sphaerisporangium album TaxID=509200 RepID=UPI0011C076A8|nr:CPBP family intramembrane glutamic endopeptidase [Sphaerisporangium album]